MLPTCAVKTENTRVIVDNPGLRPDILITGAVRAPVAVEAEFMPAATAEQEAKDRLGLEVVDGRRRIEAAIALRYPDGFEFTDDMSEGVAGARLEYAVFYEDETRFPESGWLQGTPADLADIARLVSVPQSAVNAASDAFEKGIDGGTELLKGVSEQRPAITQAIADLMGMTDVPQAHRMACAIVANAMVFHDRVAGRHKDHKDVKPLNLVCGQGVANPQANIVQAWTYILDKINYWPIFAIARDIIQQLPTAEASRLIRRLQFAAGDVAASGANVEHDLTGRVFQRLIADRKYLATFYTLPASAALLARLAVSKLQKTPSPSTGEGRDGGENAEPFDWADADAIANLRVADFACGTGALLSAVYEQIAARHEREGGDPAALHKAMMEDVLYGCDVMPSAIHITSSTLSGREPKVGYKKSRLYTLPYGRLQDDSVSSDGVSIGSLEYLNRNSQLTFTNYSNPALRTGSMGEETAASIMVDIEDESFDIVIMNPPFTRATNHEGAHADITNPAFAAFNATREDQTAMGKRLNRLGRGSAYHGNAGIASAFAALGHGKLKRGGVLALVLPLSAAVGSSWQNFRDMLTQNYTDIIVLSIAANGKDMSFSSDTGMAECLVVARKLRSDERSSGRIEFISFSKRPQGFEYAAAIAGTAANVGIVRAIDDGPYGGTPLIVGEERIGEIASAKIA